MENTGSSNTGASEDVLSVGESPADGGQGGVKKGGKFSRKKDKKKEKKKAKKAARAQDKSPTERPLDGGTAVSGHDDVHVLSTAGASPSTAQDEDGNVQDQRVTDAVSRGAAAVEIGRWNSGTGESAAGLTLLSPEGRSGPGEVLETAGESQRQPDGSSNHKRPKSRSRSGSRKRLSSLFRRRGRSAGRDDRSKSETDIAGVQDTSSAPSSDRVKSRSARSLERGQSRPVASHEAGRHTASLDRNAYRRFDPTKQPRDRLQHMTVKDAVTEYRHRHQTLANRLSSVEPAGEEARIGTSTSDPDLRPQGESDNGAVVQTSASSPVRETSLLGDSDEHADTGMSVGEGTLPRRGLGHQVREMCRTIGDVPDVGQTAPESVIFINPTDVLVDNTDNASVPGSAEHSELTDGSGASQQKVKPSDHFMELRRTVPLFSKSPAARERRISQSGDSSSAPSDRKSNRLSGSSLPSSKEAFSVPSSNIPVPGSGDINSLSLSSTASPEITVNSTQGVAGTSDTKTDVVQKMNSSATMELSMVSSTDSGKRSSDQGFFSEPRESDTDSEVDMSGFSTPPEEPDSEHDSARHSLSPSVFVSTVNNLLEVPKANSAYKRSVSDGVRKGDNNGNFPNSSSFNRTESSKSDSALMRRRVRHSPSSNLEGGELYQQQKDELKPSKDAPEGQVNQDRMEVKTVPVMGTSVQQKYRRTFSPVRSKERDLSNEKNNSLVCPSVEVNKILPLPNKSDSVLAPASPQEEQNVTSETQDNDVDNKQEGKLQRGRSSQRRQGYVSSRSFRRKKGRENKEEDTSPKDVLTVEASQDDVIDDGVEELSYRIAFQDKSIQTSDTLLNELIKRSKKRKIGLFSSSNKRSKPEQVQPSAEIPAGLPPPRYEEERPLGQIPGGSGGVEECPNPPADGSGDCVDGFTRNTEADPEIAPLLEGVETPAAEQPAEENDATPKKPSKSRGTSLRAIVALKQRLSRNRKKKETKNKKNKADSKSQNEENVEEDFPSDTFITIENELNLTKLAEIKETDILDDEIFEPDFGPALPKKQLRFEPMASDEPIQSEEPLPPLSPASRRMTARRNSTRGREKRKKCLHCCKKLIAFLFSHIGLCSLVVGYTILGGFVFQALEAPHEMGIKADVQERRVKLMDTIKSLATGFQLNELSVQNLTDALEKELKKYQKFIHREITDNGWDGNEKEAGVEEESRQWTFASALLYAITVMTTIGYGHVAPKTSYGRVVTIGYAVLGIPLTLLCLTNIGDVMASGFRMLYGKVCCGLCCKLFKPSRRRRRRVPDVEKGLARQVVITEEGETDKPKEVIQVPTSLCLLLIAAYIFAGALLFSRWEDWDFLTGSYFCFITLSTIGFGDIVPGMDVRSWSKQSKLVLSALYLIFGLSLIAMCFNLVQEDVKAKCRWIGMKIGIIDKPEPPV